MGEREREGKSKRRDEGCDETDHATD